LAALRARRMIASPKPGLPLAGGPGV